MGRRGILQANCRRGKVLGRGKPTSIWSWILRGLGTWPNGATKRARRTYGTTSSYGGSWRHGKKLQASVEIKINGCNILEVYQDEHVAIPFTVQLKLALIILVNTEFIIVFSEGKTDYSIFCFLKNCYWLTNLDVQLKSFPYIWWSLVAPQPEIPFFCSCFSHSLWGDQGLIHLTTV